MTRRRAPPWWPEGEPWPPTDWGATSPWRHRRRGHARGWPPFGCLFVLFGLFAAGTIVVGLWAAGAIIGLVDAPPVVVAAGIVAFVVVAVGASISARAFRRISQPLDELIDAAGRIEGGDYSVRVDVGGHPARCARWREPSTR